MGRYDLVLVRRRISSPAIRSELTFRLWEKYAEIDYDYPGRFTTRERGKFLSTRALERHRSDYKLAEGKGDEPTLTSGHFLTLAEHPRAEWNDLWLQLEVFHEGKQPQVLGENVTSDVTDSKSDFHQGYRNQASTKT